MTDDEIRALWRLYDGFFHGPIIETAVIREENLFAFVRRVIRDEREACAKVCDDIDARVEELLGPHGNSSMADECAEAIRKREQ